ncbi:MAG TPA: hypothetical protein VE082_02905 [Desulfobaccales bacterium]|nr:hypothetical protein [Desulfobaccales bacterium]
MADNEKLTAGEMVFKPCARSFFVYYVALFLVFLGPRINPEVGLPVWLGNILGFVIFAAFIYRRYGTEFRVTARGVARVWRWPSLRRQEITWVDLGEIMVLRGLTQSLLQVGNIAFTDKAGGPEMFWYGLPNPKDLKELIERMRP